MAKTYKPTFETYGEKGTFYTNEETYATYEEAEISARWRWQAWSMASAYEVIEVDAEEYPVNYEIATAPDGTKIRKMVNR